MIEITRFKKTGGSLTKRIHVNEDGTLGNDSSNCRMAHGTAFRQPLSDLQAFAKLIESMPDNEAIALGALRPGLPDRVAIVTKEDKRANKPAFATRTQDTVIYEKRPALVLCDFDAKNMSASVCERIEKAGGFLAALCEVCPELASAGHVRRSSTSANIGNG